jgi:hypothetical protein
LALQRGQCSVHFARIGGLSLAARGFGVDRLKDCSVRRATGVEDQLQHGLERADQHIRNCARGGRRGERLVTRARGGIRERSRERRGLQGNNLRLGG